MSPNPIATHRHAAIKGLFFITATVTAIIGLVLYKPVIDAAHDDGDGTTDRGVRYGPGRAVDHQGLRSAFGRTSLDVNLPPQDVTRTVRGPWIFAPRNRTQRQNPAHMQHSFPLSVLLSLALSMTACASAQGRTVLAIDPPTARSQQLDAGGPGTLGKWIARSRAKYERHRGHQPFRIRLGRSITITVSSN